MGHFLLTLSMSVVRPETFVYDTTPYSIIQAAHIYFMPPVSSPTSYSPRQVSRWPDVRHLPTCSLSFLPTFASKKSVSPYSPQHPLVPPMDYHCCFRCSCSHFCWSQIRCASNRCLVYKEMQPGPRK